MFKKISSLLGEHQASSFKGQKSFKKKKSTNESFDFLKLIERWPEIVGEKLSKHTIPLKNQNKTLTVLSNHSAFSEQLKFMEEPIKEKIFTAFPSLKGSIHRIIFQTNPSFFQKKKTVVDEKKKEIQRVKQALHPESPYFKKYRLEALDYFKQIDNPELKEELVSLYVQMKLIPSS